MRDVSSAFRARLQRDDVNIAELIDLEMPNGNAYHWTTANAPITFTLSGQPTVYHPFPGNPGGGIAEDTTLGVSVLDFTIANSGADLQGQLLAGDFAMAGLKVGRIFADDPSLGRMDIYLGKIGDFSYNRLQLTGQARNLWKSLNVKWPYYTYNERCGWRFGSPGCGFNPASVTLAVASVNIGSSTTIDIRLPTGTLSAYTSGRFNFGRLTVTGGTNSGHVRTIRIHSGDLISLSHVLPNPDLTGMTVSIYPGCTKRLVEDCKSLYNNDKNFLGWPWIPIEEDAW